MFKGTVPGDWQGLIGVFLHSYYLVEQPDCFFSFNCFFELQFIFKVPQRCWKTVPPFQVLGHPYANFVSGLPQYWKRFAVGCPSSQGRILALITLAEGIGNPLQIVQYIDKFFSPWFANNLRQFASVYLLNSPWSYCQRVLITSRDICMRVAPKTWNVATVLQDRWETLNMNCNAKKQLKEKNPIIGSSTR